MVWIRFRVRIRVIYLNLFVSPGYLLILMILITVVKFKLVIFSSKAIVIINFETCFIFFRRFKKLIDKYSVNLRKFLQQRISGQKFYGDLVYKFKFINLGEFDFSTNSKRSLTVTKE